ncbi:MAG: MarR family winged helix-turn-helix transcriptional regulator [Granulosicoccus sp.]
MTTKIPETPESIGRQLNFTTGRMNALCQQVLEPYDLSLQQWVVLSCLWRGGELTVGVISELVGSGLPATSRIIDRMVARGLVRRRQDESDGRVTLIKVTEKARELEHLASFYEMINDALFTDFSAEEREQSFDLLRRMEVNAKKALE